MAHRWYVIHVYSGFERQVAEKIEEQALQSHHANEIEKVLVPMSQSWSPKAATLLYIPVQFFIRYLT